MDLDIIEWSETVTIDRDFHGIVSGMPDRLYHATGRLSNSKLKYFVSDLGGSPLKYWAQFLTDYPTKTPQTAEIGTLLHALLLEGRNSFEGLFKVCEADFSAFKSPKGSKAWKDFKAVCDAEGVIPLLPYEAERYEHVLEAIAMQTADYQGKVMPITNLFQHGEPELSVFCNFPGTEEPFQIRVDYAHIREGRHILLDLKTTSGSGHPSEWSARAFRFGAHMQAYNYSLIWEKMTGVKPLWFFVVVEQDFPHLTRLVPCSDRMMELGQLHSEEAIDLYLSCIESGDWSPPSKTIEVDAKPWMNFLTGVEE